MPTVPHQLAQYQPDNNSLAIERWRLQRLSLRKRLLELMCSHLCCEALDEQETCLEALCGELIDYISTGHFEIYDGLLRRQPRYKPDMRTLIDYLLRCIGNSTDFVLDFNAECERADAVLDIDVLGDSLGQLTRSLLVRFAIEEQLLELTAA